MSTSTIFCPDCGARNDRDARFCDACGRKLDDVRQITSERREMLSPEGRDSAGRMIARDGQPVGDDPVEAPGGERVLWEGRPSLLWSPRLSLTQRYRLTSQRLIITYGFIGRRTEEMDLYRVNDVSVKQHPLERITHMGDVTVYASDSSAASKTLLNVTGPDRVKDMIRDAARIERQRRRVLLREEF